MYFNIPNIIFIMKVVNL